MEVHEIEMVFLKKYNWYGLNKLFVKTNSMHNFSRKLQDKYFNVFIKYKILCQTNIYKYNDISEIW